MPTTPQLLAASEKAEHLELKQFCGLGSIITTLNSLQQNCNQTATTQITVSKFLLHETRHHHRALHAGITEKQVKENVGVIFTTCNV